MELDQLELAELVEDEKPEQKEYNNEDLYKKWFRGKDQAGFLSIRPWPEARKFVVDIGKSDPNTNKLLSHTNAFLDGIMLAAYIKAVVNGRAAEVYPANGKQGVATPEGLTVYGGSGSVSRVFKSSHWPLGKDSGYDSSRFRWAIAHFEGTVTASGAIMPNMDKPLSMDFIQVTRRDMNEISYYLDLELANWVNSGSLWYA